MAVNSYTRLNKHVSQVGETLLTSQIESNMKSYLDWGLLGIGSFSNVSIPTSGAFGGTFDKLRLVDDPSYSQGQIWEAARKDWVWETGVYYDTQPVQMRSRQHALYWRPRHPAGNGTAYGGARTQGGEDALPLILPGHRCG